MIALTVKLVGAATALLASWSTAAPTSGGGSGWGGGSGCVTESVDANFDDIAQAPVGVTAKMPTPYDGLYYQSFVPGTPMTEGVTPGMIPHSSPNLIATNVLTQATGGTPMLTVNYPGSTVSNFTLSSFYFGCLVMNGPQTVTAEPMQCLINLAGYSGNDNQVSGATELCSQQFEYKPSTMTGPQQMAFSGPVFSCFKDMRFLVFTYSLPGGTAALNAANSLLLDDIKYTYQNCTA